MTIEIMSGAVGVVQSPTTIVLMANGLNGTAAMRTKEIGTRVKVDCAVNRAVASTAVVDPAAACSAEAGRAAASMGDGSTAAVNTAVLDLAAASTVNTAAIIRQDRAANISRAVTTTAPAEGIAITRAVVKAGTAAQSVTMATAVVIAQAKATASAGVVTSTIAVTMVTRRNAAGWTEQQTPSPRGLVTKRRSGGRRMDEQRRYRGRGPKGYRRSDERIKEDVNDRLSEGYLDASDVEVNVMNCEVTLTGTVNSRTDKRRAEDIAESIMGVTNVENRIRVQQSDLDRYPGLETTSTAGTTGTTGTTGSTGTTGTTGASSSAATGTGTARGKTAGTKPCASIFTRSAP